MRMYVYDKDFSYAVFWGLKPIFFFALQSSGQYVVHLVC